MTGDLCARVVAIVAEALDVTPERVRLDSSLIDDLGAESIDFLDILFRVETAFGIKIPEDEMWKGVAPRTVTVRTIVDYLGTRGVAPADGA